MNVFYICCIADPFLEVAKRLQKEHGLNPVYWIADKATIKEGDNTEQLLKEAFPDCIYHEYYSAWHGVFPKEIEEIANDTYVDVDLLRRFSSEEMQSFTMMNRLDYDRKSFNYMERERFYIRLVKCWSACLDLLKPDLVVAARIPHRVFDYVLYLLCQYRNIPMVSFEFSGSFKRLLLLDEFSDPGRIPSILKERFDYYLAQNKLDENNLPEDILANYTRTRSNYKVARPVYMKKHDAQNKQILNPFFLIKRFFTSNHFFGKKSIFVKGSKTKIYKNRKYGIEHAGFALLDWYPMIFAANRFRKKLRALYGELAKPVDTSVPYIVLYLHYQPESTTSPRGDIFTNQQLCIETLLKHTPENCMIYVKEHPTQFMSHTLGQTSRIVDFYKDLSKYSRVRLVPLEMDSFAIMQNAKAVVTVAGTVGWEALLHHKPVIVFGLCWYEAMKGVLRVYDEESASTITPFIESYQYDEHAILAYLFAISDLSFIAYHYDGFQNNKVIAKEDCVNNMVQALERYLASKNLINPV